jgi:hypothetical protein
VRAATDLDVPTVIRRGLDNRDRQFRTRNDPDGLLSRCRFRALFVEFCRRATAGDLVWR